VVWFGCGVVWCGCVSGAVGGCLWLGVCVAGFLVHSCVCGWVWDCCCLVEVVLGTCFVFMHVAGCDFVIVGSFCLVGSV